MTRFIPAAERITRARGLIKKAYDVPSPSASDFVGLTFMAQVRDLLQQARDLVKFIPYTPTATDTMKEEVKQIFAEIEQAEKELLHKGKTHAA
jgi:hypothetical protein